MSAPYLLGLTGSVGMGKSTTASLFAELGVPVWDADATVHALYAFGGAGVAVIAELAPDAIAGGAVDRARLKAAIEQEPGLLDRVEARIHPLVAADRRAFIARHVGAPLLVLDIPLLFETGAEHGLDGVLVVTAALPTQRARVLARPGMTEAMFERILARQLSDADKRARADFLLETDHGIDAARAGIRALVQRLTAGSQDA